VIVGLAANQALALAHGFIRIGALAPVAFLWSYAYARAVAPLGSDRR